MIDGETLRYAVGIGICKRSDSDVGVAGVGSVGFTHVPISAAIIGSY